VPIAETLAMQVNDAMRDWHQGDVALEPGVDFVHMADLTKAHSPSSSRLREAVLPSDIPVGPTPVADSVPGFVVVTQTCDLRRDCRSRPFAEVVPLIDVSPDELEAVRRLKKPAFGYVPAVADRQYVADLDRIMTVEKALIASWLRLDGLTSAGERRDFSRMLSRKWTRMAFPDDFVEAARRIRSRFLQKHQKMSAEGAHMRALREIRVAAAPSWNDRRVDVTWWFIRATEPKGYPVTWTKMTKGWVELFDSDGRFRTDNWIACRLEDLTARDYVESDKLDLDQLSVERRKWVVSQQGPYVDA